MIFDTAAIKCLWKNVDQVWSILIHPFACGVNSRGGATPMHAKWIKLDLERMSHSKPGIFVGGAYVPKSLNSQIFKD